MKTWLVTGANRGIGAALVQQLAARGERVFAVSRGARAEAKAQENVTYLDGVELTAAADLEALARRLEGERLDVLLHNAGLLIPDGLGAVDAEAVRAQFEINALAPLLLTQALSAQLHAGARIAIVTSRMGSVADNTSGAFYGYRMSKAAVNMAARSLTLDLKGRGIAVGLFHPGYVRTGMTGGNGEIEPEVSARGLLQHIDALTLSNTGGFWHATQGTPLPW